MSDILVTKLNAKKCGLSVWNQDESSCICFGRPEHSMTLRLANGREGTRPWYSSIEFTSRAEWFRFVKLVNDMNKMVKRLPKDEWGFPILPKEE